MDWSITSSYADANHHPVAVLNGDVTRRVLEISAAPGSSVELSAADSSDPDGDDLNYSWRFFEEPSSYDGSVEIKGKATSTAIIEVPSGASGQRIHIVLEGEDDGSPHLIAYRRMPALGKRILYGTDLLIWPGLLETSIGVIQHADYLSEDQKRDILFYNTVRFFKLDASKYE